MRLGLLLLQLLLRRWRHLVHGLLNGMLLGLLSGLLGSLVRGLLYGLLGGLLGCLRRLLGFLLQLLLHRPAVGRLGRVQSGTLLLLLLLVSRLRNLRLFHGPPKSPSPRRLPLWFECCGTLPRTW